MDGYAARAARGSIRNLRIRGDLSHPAGDLVRLNPDICRLDEISRPAARSLVLLLLTVFFFSPNAVSDICFVAVLFSEISSSPSADSEICLPRYLFSDIFFPHKNKSPEVRYLETHSPIF